LETGGPQLDPSQLAIVELPADARVLVIAGAGQGKTEVVAARLQHLVEEEGLEPADEIVVLSFSRAAVAAARHRTRGRGAVARVAVSTFDSLASRLLLEAGVDVVSPSFDGRIRQARELLEVEDADLPTLDMLRHVIVDEVQDLVGDRASFVHQLLIRLDDDAGFTALGDPLQAIYEFQLDPSARQMPNEELLRALTEELGARKMSLERHYRARSREAEEVVELARTLRGSTSGSRRLALAEAFVLTLPGLDYPDDLERAVPRWTGRTAILSRTNGQGMTISEELAKAGLAHSLRHPAADLAVPAWVAAALGGAPSQRLDRETVMQRVDDTPGAPPADLAWRVLKATERRRRAPDLDIVALAGRLGAGDVPVELAGDLDVDLIVSTVHQAKGLEFDNVLVTEGPARKDADEDPDTRAREIFVAVSRARDRLFTFEAPDMRMVIKETLPPKRWIRTGRESWMTSRFELRPGDIETLRPASGPDRDAVAVQQALAVGIRPGTLAEAALEPESASADIPRYRVSIGGRTVGRTNEAFGVALAQRLDRVWRNHPTWPSGMSDIVVNGVVTVAGPPLVGEHAGVGRWGLWLAIRAGGLPWLKYEKGA
jgi:DNA helicase-2/ATP-dependent DNA helicase PcrA